MLIGTTFVVLAGTFIAATLLLGRFALLTLGFFTAGSTLIGLADQFLNGWEGTVALIAAFILMLLGRPDFARRSRIKSSER